MISRTNTEHSQFKIKDFSESIFLDKSEQRTLNKVNIIVSALLYDYMEKVIKILLPFLLHV